MAVKKPLVVGTDGLPCQIQAGDTLAGGSELGQFTLTPTATLIAGNAVYESGNDAATKAQANAASTAKVVALATTAITGSSPGTFQSSDLITLTTGQWDAVAGTTGGLTAGTIYFLDPATAGKITATVPTTVGQLVVRIGIAISTTELLLGIRDPILL